MNLLTHTRPKSSCPSLSLPPLIDCPARNVSVQAARANGRVPICSECYALKGRYVFAKVHGNQLTRSDWWHRTAPKERAIILADAVQRENVRFFRGYDSGDLDPSAIETWLEFADRLPDVAIWMPTRTWLLPEFLPGLQLLNAHPRIVVRPSASGFDEPPPRVPGLSGGHASHWKEEPKASYTCPGNCARCRVCWERPALSVGFPKR